MCRLTKLKIMKTEAAAMETVSGLLASRNQTPTGVMDSCMTTRQREKHQQCLKRRCRSIILKLRDGEEIGGWRTEFPCVQRRRGRGRTPVAAGRSTCALYYCLRPIEDATEVACMTALASEWLWAWPSKPKVPAISHAMRKNTPSPKLKEKALQHSEHTNTMHVGRVPCDSAQEARGDCYHGGEPIGDAQVGVVEGGCGG